MNASEPLTGIQVMLVGTKNASTSTDGSGAYTFMNLLAGGNYTISPVRPGMNFTPASRALSKLTKDESADFFGVEPPQVYKISGRVVDVRGALAGVKINLEGSKLTSATTDSNGYYSFRDLRAGGSYTILPKGQLRFTPSSRSLNNLRQDASVDFSVVDQPAVYRISGRVRDSRQPLSGIRITLDGTKSGSAMTDANGYYSFSELPAGGNFIISPRAQLSFTPSSRSLNNLRQDASADFSAIDQRNDSNGPDESDDSDGPVEIVSCTEADQARERAALLNQHAGTWERGIESEKSRVIAKAVRENTPAGNANNATEASATLGPIRYEVTFHKCKPRIVTAIYQWTVRLFINPETRTVAVQNRRTCVKVLGAWVCR